MLPIAQFFNLTEECTGHQYATSEIIIFHLYLQEVRDILSEPIFDFPTMFAKIKLKSFCF